MQVQTADKLIGALRSMALGMEWLAELDSSTDSAKALRPFLNEWDGAISSRVLSGDDLDRVAGDLDTVEKRADAGVRSIAGKLSALPPAQRNSAVQKLLGLAERTKSAVAKRIANVSKQIAQMAYKAGTVPHLADKALKDSTLKILKTSYGHLKKAVATTADLGLKAVTYSAGYLALVVAIAVWIFAGAKGFRR